jgi:SAM-dependent methyltransferase
VREPRTYRRALRRLRRRLHPVRLEPLLANIDENRLRQLRLRCDSLSPDSPSRWRHYAKYLDVEKHLRQNIERAQDLNLHRSSPLEILDLGCGGGFFLFVAQSLGHHGIGLDVSGIPVFDGLVNLLGVNRLPYEIRSQTALPDFGRKFDLITGFATAFHGGREDAWRWDERDWDFFLNDLKRQLKPAGRIFFELNAAYGRHYYTPGILKVILRHGGRVERGHVLFLSRENLTAQRIAKRERHIGINDVSI